MMSLIQDIVRFSSLKEPYAGGRGNFPEQIKASLPFLRLIPENKKRVLVVGCGEGYEVKWLADRGFEVRGVTNETQEAITGVQKYNLYLGVADIHRLPFRNNYFDCVYAANILEHSVAPYIALREWRRVLKKGGWLIIVMPSKEWLAEYYHFSVLTHSQTKDLLSKSGFQLLSGPEMKPEISLGKGDIFYDLGRGWGHYDAYVSQKTSLPKSKFMLGKYHQIQNLPWPFQLIKAIIKRPYNLIRIWRARYHHE